MYQFTVLAFSDVKVCRGADIGSDHYLVRGRLKVDLSQWLRIKIYINKNHVPAIERLLNVTKIEEYNVALKNRFELLDSEVDLERMWGQFKQTVSDVSMEVLGKRPPKVKEQHLSQKTKDLLIQRGRFKRKDPNSEANRSQYSKLNKLVKKSSKIDDNNWAIQIATELEEAASKGQQREVWVKIKKISGKSKKNRVTYVRDRKGKMITDPRNQKDRSPPTNTVFYIDQHHFLVSRYCHNFIIKRPKDKSFLLMIFSD